MPGDGRLKYDGGVGTNVMVSPVERGEDSVRVCQSIASSYWKVNKDSGASECKFMGV